MNSLLRCASCYLNNFNILRNAPNNLMSLKTYIPLFIRVCKIFISFTANSRRVCTRKWKRKWPCYRKRYSWTRYTKFLWTEIMQNSKSRNAECLKKTWLSLCLFLLAATARNGECKKIIADYALLSRATFQQKTIRFEGYANNRLHLHSLLSTYKHICHHT